MTAAAARRGEAEGAYSGTLVPMWITSRSSRETRLSSALEGMI
jgi:hypothetical protein